MHSDHAAAGTAPLQRMKIAFIAGRLSRRASGVKVVVEHLSAALAAQGHEVRVFGIKDEAWSAGDQAMWTGAPASTFRAFGPANFGYTPGMNAALRAFAPDIIHAHGLWMYGSVVASRLARDGVANVVSPHGMLDAWALRQSRLKKRIVRAAFENAHLKQASAVHALNDEEAQAVRKFGVFAPIATLPNGVELAPVHQMKSPPRWAKTLPAGAKVLLFLGRLHPKKNLPNLIEAWAEARQSPWHLVIAGPDQDGHQAMVEAQIAKHGLSNTVHVLGPQYGPDKDASFGAADAFVLPSHSEGLPMSVLEAWSWRLPVLMSRQCNLPEGFEAGAALETGITSGSIASALSRLMQASDAQRAAIGMAGRSLVEQKYSWEQVAENFSQLYTWCRAGAPSGTRSAFIGFEQETVQK